jgi:hypothetical protein
LYCSSLFSAGASGLIVFSHGDERPDSYLEPSFFKNDAFEAKLQMCWNATSRRLDSPDFIQQSSMIGSEPPIERTLCVPGSAHRGGLGDLCEFGEAPSKTGDSKSEFQRAKAGGLEVVVRWRALWDSNPCYRRERAAS